MSQAVTLRPVSDADLPIFFAQQCDPDANWMAAFTAKDPTDKDAFMAHWAKIRNVAGITIRTIVSTDEVAGYVLCHDWFGDPELTYWLGKSFWGRGIATQALQLFLGVVTVRPLYARVVVDNHASRRVLEKCGFIISGEATGFALARAAEVAEYILRLDGERAG